MKPLIIYSVLLIVCWINCSGQRLMKIYSNSTCVFDGSVIELDNEEVYCFPASNEAKTIINDILAKVGLKPNFTILAADIYKACATIPPGSGQKYILYNEDFIKTIDLTSKSNWPSIFILAHEIGHHLNGHTFNPSGNRQLLELDADEFAGFVLFKLGATLNETKLAINTLPEAGNSTHPSRSARLQASTVGWTKAKEEGEKAGKVIKQRIEYLEVSVKSFKKTVSGYTLTLKFYPDNDQYGIVYALKAAGSDGIADYWKFNPYAKGKLTDNLGNEYFITSISGMGYAREINDWTSLRKREEATATIEFGGNSSHNINVGDKFDFTLDVWLVYANSSGNSIKGAYSINLQGINLKK